MEKLDLVNFPIWSQGAGTTLIPTSFNGMEEADRLPARWFNWLTQQNQNLAREAFSSRLSRFTVAAPLPTLGGAAVIDHEAFGCWAGRFVYIDVSGNIHGSVDGLDWVDTGEDWAQSYCNFVDHGYGGLIAASTNGYVLDYPYWGATGANISLPSGSNLYFAQGGSLSPQAVSISGVTGSINYAADYRSGFFAASTPPTLGTSEYRGVCFIAPDVFALVTNDGKFSLSSDGGDTWSSLVQISYGAVSASSGFDIKSNGSRIMVSAYRSPGSHYCVFYSDDLGGTWTYTDLLGANSGSQTVGRLSSLGHGMWYAAGRINNSGTSIYQYYSYGAFSFDDGATWSGVVLPPDNFENATTYSSFEAVCSKKDVVLRMLNGEAFRC